MSKKLLVLLFAMLVMVAFVACGDKDDGPKTTSKAASSSSRSTGTGSGSSSSSSIPAYVPQAGVEAFQSAWSAAINDDLVDVLNDDIANGQAYSAAITSAAYSQAGGALNFVAAIAQTTSANGTLIFGLSGKGVTTGSGDGATYSFTGAKWAAIPDTYKNLTFWFKGGHTNAAIRFEVGGGSTNVNFFDMSEIVTNIVGTEMVGKLGGSTTFNSRTVAVADWTKVRIDLAGLSTATVGSSPLNWTDIGLRFRTRVWNSGGGGSINFWVKDFLYE